MSEYGMFWNSRDGDRKYNADDFTDWLKKFFTNGVFNGELYVTSTGGMGISVSPGYVNVDGKVMFFEESQLFTLDVAYSNYNRVDTVVIERNDADRLFTCKVVKGGTDGAPIPPVRENGVYQLVLAQIAIRRGASSITQENVTDTRMDSNLCGYVAGTVDEITWDQITAQWTKYLEDYKHNQLEDYTEWTAEMKAAWLAWIAEQETGFTDWFADRRAEWNDYRDDWLAWVDTQETEFTTWSDAQRALWTGWIATQETDFLAWYDRMKDQLSEDAAGHLQLEIDAETSAREASIQSESSAREAAVSDIQTILGDIEAEAGSQETEVTFNQDGSITEVTPAGTKSTVFNADGSITETYPSGRVLTTVFNDDGSISRTLSN